MYVYMHNRTSVFWQNSNMRITGTKDCVKKFKDKLPAIVFIVLGRVFPRETVNGGFCAPMQRALATTDNL